MIESPSPTRLSKVQGSGPPKNLFCGVMDQEKKKTWFQSWMPKIARAFGLDAVPESQEKKKTWFQSWMMDAISYRGAEQNVEVLRCASTVDKNRDPAPAASAVQRASPAGRLMRSESRGDTMVEVMISTAVLAIILATAYTTSTRSLQNGLNAKYRNQVLTYARAQLELIKSADNNQPSTVDAYKLTRPFCINPSNAQVQEVDNTTKVCSLPIGETNPANQIGYTVVDNYSSASKTFTTTVQWLSANNVSNQTALYYKPHDSFVVTPGL